MKNFEERLIELEERMQRHEDAVQGPVLAIADLHQRIKVVEAKLEGVD